MGKRVYLGTGAGARTGREGKKEGSSRDGGKVGSNTFFGDAPMLIAKRELILGKKTGPILSERKKDGCERRGQTIPDNYDTKNGNSVDTVAPYETGSAGDHRRKRCPERHAQMYCI